MPAVIAVFQNFEIISLKDRPEFADVCAAWDYAEWGCFENRCSLSETMDDYNATPDDNALPATWICISDGKPAGSVRLKRNDHPDYPDLNPWLSSLYVHPSFRNRGIGSALCLRVMQEAKANHGFAKLFLYTPGSGSQYERLGWRTIGMVKDPAGLKSEGDILMTFDLG